MPTIERGDCQLWWDDRGDPGAAPVLLIMGLGYPSSMWYRWLPRLAERYRVVSFDNRGVGKTGVPPGPYTIEQMADDAAAVLDAAGIRRAHVIGASMGGIIGQELALTHPDRVESLALVCTAPGGQQMAPSDPGATEMAMARSHMTPAEAAEAAVPFVYARTTPRERIDEDIAVRMAQPTDPEGYTNQLGAVMTYQGSHARLPQLRAPTLVLHGKDDRLVPPANAQILANAITGARLVLLDDASHILMTDQPERSLDAILEFLATASTPTS